MFNIATMKTALFGQIGFRESEDPCYGSLLSTLTASSTGMYFNDYHPLITFENLQALAPNYDGYTVTAWDTDTEYAIGDLAKDDGVVWKALAVNTATEPESGAVWKLPLNDWLTQKVNASISKVLNSTTRSKKLTESTKTLLENVQLFDGAGRFQDTITASGRFVGLELTPKKINNIALILDYIGLQFSSIQTALTIYVFHSSRSAAIDTQDITTLAANSFHWTAGTIENLDYVDYTNHFDSGGSFYIGYFEDDITGSAINKKDQFRYGAGGICYCGNGNNMWNKFFDVRPIEVSSDNLNGVALWDLSKTGYQSDTNFGLNLSVSVKTDVTDVLVSNKSVFIDALGYQFAYDMLQEMLNNPTDRLNRLVDNAQKKAAIGIQELNESDMVKTTLKEAIEAVSFDLSRLSQVLPTDMKKRGSWGAI